MHWECFGCTRTPLVSGQLTQPRGPRVCVFVAVFSPFRASWAGGACRPRVCAWLFLPVRASWSVRTGWPLGRVPMRLTDPAAIFVFFPCPPGCVCPVTFSFFFSLRPACLRLSLVYGTGCPGSRRFFGCPPAPFLFSSPPPCLHPFCCFWPWVPWAPGLCAFPPPIPRTTTPHNKTRHTAEPREPKPAQGGATHPHNANSSAPRQATPHHRAQRTTTRRRTHQHTTAQQTTKSTTGRGTTAKKRQARAPAQQNTTCTTGQPEPQQYKKQRPPAEFGGGGAQRTTTAPQHSAAHQGKGPHQRDQYSTQQGKARG